MKVELDVFSGRPNPEWELTLDEAVEFARLFALLHPGGEGHSGPPGLGYRGFHVSGVGPYTAVTVWHEFVEALDSRQIRLWDGSRALETLLLESGRAHLGSDLYQTVIGLVAAG